MVSFLVLAHTFANQTVRLDTLNLQNVVQEWGQATANRSVENNPLSIGTHKYEHGIGTHANEVILINLNRQALRFAADVGVDGEVKQRGTIQFEVIGDGKSLWKSEVLKGGQDPVHVDISIKGVKELRLTVNDAADGNDYDHADWADAVFTVKDGAHIDTVPTPVDPPLPIATAESAEPQINGPRVIGCSSGNPFFFRVPVTGQQPLTVSVTGLPEGLSYNSTTHIISGTVTEQGTSKVEIQVDGSAGTTHRTLSIVCGVHKLALTPPMGWNSWNVWGTSVTAEKFKTAADCFVNDGLADYGYRFVNIDDTWEGDRNARGEIQTNEKFGDIASLAQYVHSKGLGLGIYSSPGEKTCAGFAGSYAHELQDAQTYGKWGVDYLKYDWCSYAEKVPPHPTVEQLQHPYKVMREALDQSGRDITFSLCQYGMGDVFKWGKDVGGNLWRTTGDINDSYGSMTSIAFQHDEKAIGVSPGGWNDPDMLVVGDLGWGPNPKPTKLKPNEQIMHITMWSMLAAPLILGCDLTKLDPWTKALVTNHDMIEIDQDPLGKPARRFKARANGLEIWTRPLWDGTMAVAIMNRGTEHIKGRLAFASLHLKGSQPVYDVWKRKSLGRRRSLTVQPPIHGATLFRVGKAKP